MEDIAERARGALAIVFVIYDPKSVETDNFPTETQIKLFYMTGICIQKLF